MLACMSAQGRQAHGRMQILLLFLGMVQRHPIPSSSSGYGNSLMHVRRA